MNKEMKEFSSKTILIVEDDNLARRALKRVLQLEGWKTLEASNGVEGLRMFRSQLPEIVLTDVVMPGFDGFFLTAVIKSISPQSPVIIMTGLCEDELDGKAYDLGVSAFLRKPFEPEHLLVALDQLVGNSNGKKQ
jgi:CheY-like chemotaxis protein